MIRYTCASCGAQLESPEDMAGRVDRCPSCGGNAPVPPLAGAPAQPLAASALDQLAAASRQPLIPPSTMPYGQPDPRYNPYARSGPVGNAPGAVASMVCGIIGLVCFGIILGIVAICLGASASGKIRKFPGQYTGGGMATAGIVLGVIDIIGQIVGLFIIFGMRH